MCQKHGCTPHRSRGTPHFSSWPAEHTESPQASPLASAAFTPESCQSKPLFVSAGAESCLRSSKTNADASFPTCRRGTHPNTGPSMGSISTYPQCGVVRQRHFLLGHRKYPSLPRKAAEAQRAQVADTLPQINSPIFKKALYADKGMDKFLSAYSTLHHLTRYPGVETFA